MSHVFWVEVSSNGQTTVADVSLLVDVDTVVAVGLESSNPSGNLDRSVGTSLGELENTVGVGGSVGWVRGQHDCRADLLWNKNSW